MEIYDYFIRNHRNKFVVTEDGAYFVPCSIGNAVPPFADILAEVFDLGNPEVVKTLDEKFNSGTLILGYLEADGKLDIHLPSEQNEYVQKRLEEVFEAGLGMESERKVFERLMPSPYIEQMKRELPDSTEKNRYLSDLRNLKRLMIRSSRLGGTGYGGAILKRGLSDKYPEAHEAFERELAMSR